MQKSIYPHFLCLALLLTATACAPVAATKSTPKSEELPVAKTVEKIEEPSVKKPELTLAKKAEQELKAGIRHYEEGNYKNAAGYFQNALDGELASIGDQITAHKYLAFIYCVSDEKLACRAEFKKVLRLNSKFNLTRAEAGHPIWGPVFRALKAEEAGKPRSKK